MITNLVGSHNALIPILVTNAFAATLLLFALPKMLDGFLSETHHSQLKSKIGTDIGHGQILTYWCLFVHIGSPAGIFQGPPTKADHERGWGVEGARRRPDKR